MVAKLGFNPLSSAGRETGRFPPALRQGGRIGRAPCPLALRIKALVWHDERMAKDVSRGPSEDVFRDPPNPHGQYSHPSERVFPPPSHNHDLCDGSLEYLLALPLSMRLELRRLRLANQ